MEIVYEVMPEDLIVVDERRAIVTSNILASDPEGDTEDRARGMAEELDERVLMIRRPYSGTRATFDLGAYRSMQQPHENARLAAETGKTVARYCEVEGITSLTFSGHSAAASFLAEVVATETTPAGRIAVTDPPGLFPRPPFTGQFGWAAYTLHEARHKPKELTDAERAGYDPQLVSPRTFLPRQVREIFTHSRYWRSGETAEALRYIASELTGIEVFFGFPEHTPNASPVQREAWVNDLNHIGRTRAAIGAATVHARIMAGTWHNTFDVPTPNCQILRDQFPGQYPPAPSF